MLFHSDQCHVAKTMNSITSQNAIPAFADHFLNGSQRNQTGGTCTRACMQVEPLTKGGQQEITVQNRSKLKNAISTLKSQFLTSVLRAHEMFKVALVTTIHRKAYSYPLQPDSDISVKRFPATGVATNDLAAIVLVVPRAFPISSNSNSGICRFLPQIRQSPGSCSI